MRLLIEIFALLLAFTAMARAGDLKTPVDSPANRPRAEKQADPPEQHLRGWEREVLDNLQLLENLEMLQKMDLFSEDLSVFGVEDQP